MIISALLFCGIILFFVMRIQNTSRMVVATRESYSLGTIIKLKAIGRKANEAIEEAISEINELDDKMSAFKDNSEVSKLNESAGLRAEIVSEETYEVIKKAVVFSKLSGGTYDPTIRPLVNVWNNSIKNAQIPDEETIKQKLKLTNCNDIEFNDEERSIGLKHTGQQLDLGGIAKGFATDAIRDIFIRNNIKSGLIDLGGNVYALGSKPDSECWNIGVQNPFSQRGEYVGILSVQNKSVVTSGNYEKFFVKDDKIFHHIIDPRTGYPSESEIVSATIVSEDSLVGDGLSTGVYILGVEASLRLNSKLQNVDMILVTEDKKIYITENIEKNFKLTDKNFELIGRDDYYEKN